MVTQLYEQGWSSWPIIEGATLIDCLFLFSHFHENQASGGSGDTTAVTVYRVLLIFHGNNTFLGNQGGGTSLLSSRMDVRGHVLFDGNVAVFGAGVAMAGRSLVSVCVCVCVYVCVCVCCVWVGWWVGLDCQRGWCPDQ